ncbi:MAG TPA: Fic family protein [Solirubrobacterales bacterium]
MLFATPKPSRKLKSQLSELDELRQRLHQDVGAPKPWMGGLRRSVQASSVAGSTAIEGFTVSQQTAEALVAAADAGASEDENRQAVAAYARAMEHVGAMAADPRFRWQERVVLDLHFDACHFQRDQGPGNWRQGPIGVTGKDGSLEYRAPEAKQVPKLMAEAVRWLAKGDLDAHVVIRAAMAHLHVTSVHPFSDGNGRVSRIVQSLVLALDGLVSPEFASIEEYLGTHTPAYYEALRDTQGGSYQPDRDTTGWIEFCLEAHLAQARQRLRQIDAAAARWGVLEELTESRNWPDRLIIALEQSLRGDTDRARYAAGAEVSTATASTDLKRLLDASLLTQLGRGRTTHYRASEELLGRVAS